jgi:NADH-quinone oxidoreductase subunit G/[NiFe] hydrogenase diaphorase moiety small subunit
MANEVTINIDGKDVTVPSGTTILEAAAKLNIRIPTLCHHKDLCTAGNCRMCVVEIEGDRRLQASCVYPVTQPMKIKTTTPKIRQARKHILELLISEHYGECNTCGRNNNCELQALTAEYGIDGYTFGHVEEPVFVRDDSGYSIVRDMNKCVLCRRCVRTCADLQQVGALGIADRSDSAFISTVGNMPLSEAVCINCGQCINRCPTGALTEKNYIDEIWAAIDNPKKHVVIQTAPAPRAGIGECFGLAPGNAMTFQLNTALRNCGFDKVFDTNFSADLTIIEEGTELLVRLYKALVEKEQSVSLPQFTSCSPGWIKFIEHFYPDMLEHLSSAKSPQQMFGAVIKTYYAQMHNIDPKDIVTVALMPCTAKKFEANRPEMRDSGYQDVDYGLTTRELASMIKQAGMFLPDLPKSDFDDPFGTATGSGVIFAASGGVMEAALRTVIEIVCGIKVENLFEHANIIPVRGFEGARIVELPPIQAVGPVPEILKNAPFKDWEWLKGAALKVGVCHGTANAKKVLDDISAGGEFSTCHFIEFMACPGGCLGGGGQPIPTNQEIREARSKAIYDEDVAYEVRKSHENPAVLKIYNEFLQEGPCGHKSHKLLHTGYTARGKNLL